MKYYANRRRSERTFEVGDLVLLKLHPYKQILVRGYTSHKLTASYYGPYPVIANVGTVAYQLQLPPGDKIHNDFHVSLLRSYCGSNAVATNVLPTFWVREEKLPEKILQRRMVKKGNKAVSQVLVKWRGFDESDSTWEEHSSLKQYPNFEDEVLFVGQI